MLRNLDSWQCSFSSWSSHTVLFFSSSGEAAETRDRLAWPERNGPGTSEVAAAQPLWTCTLRRAEQDGPACLVFQALPLREGEGGPLQEAGGEQPEDRAKTPGVTAMCKWGKGLRQVLGSFSCFTLEQRLIGGSPLVSAGSRLMYTSPCHQLHKHLPISLNLVYFVPRSTECGWVHGVQLAVSACLAYMKSFTESPAPHTSARGGSYL